VSVRIIACLNPASNERTEFYAEPGSVKDIITSLDTGFPPSHARVCLNGEIIKDFSVIANDGDILSIKFVPYGSPDEAGAGMKIGGWALMGVGVAALFIPGIGGFLGAALIGSGLSMALGGTVLLNMDIPKIGSTEKPEQDPSIRGGKNQARPHGRIPVLFGKRRIYPDIAANPYTEIIEGKQYYTQLFCGGYKDYIIDKNSFKLGDTPLIDYSQTKDIDQILSNADPFIKLEVIQDGRKSSIYPCCVHEDAVNAPLENKINDGGGNKISGQIIRTTPDNTDKINLDIFFHNGLGKYNNENKLGSASVEVKASYKKAGDPDSSYQLLGYFNGDSNTITAAELKTKRCQITKDDLEPEQYTIKIERVTPDSEDGKIIDQVYIGSVRSYKSKSRPVNPERQGNLTITAMRVMANSGLNGIIDGFNYIATSKLPVYSGGGSGKNYWLSTAETCNPASALLYALQGQPAQQRVDSNDIDWQSLEALYLWCEEHEYTCSAYITESFTIAELMRMIGRTARADILRIDSRISVVQDIERPAHKQLFTPKNSIAYSVTMFNADIPDAISLKYIDAEAGYTQNELTVYNTPDGSREKEPETIQKVDLFGVTDSRQARRIGMYNYGCLKNRPFVHTIETDIEYLIVNKGDWIQYAGDIALTGSVQGRIKGVIWEEGVCIGIDTDEPVAMEAGKQYAVRIRKYNGEIVLKDVVFNPGKQRQKSLTYYPAADGLPSSGGHDPQLGFMYAVDEDNVYYEPQNIILFIEPIKERDAPKAGDIYAFGIRGYEALDLVITDIQPGQNLTAVLTCVEYSPEIFRVDDPDFVLPEFVNRITPVSGAVDSGIVNPDNWSRFVIFHDDDAEPPAPEGDGQNDGWHYVQTYRSVWQSSKMAESIDTGVWGLPVRIKAQRNNDDITPVWLSLTPQNKILECDADGNILAELLPFTVHARLHLWNSVLPDAAFSLLNAPAGVFVNDAGEIIISKNAVLDDVNNIIVRAEHKGGVYSSALAITLDRRSFAPRYLGTVEALSDTSSVTILKGAVLGNVQARQSDYVLAVAPVNNRQAGSVFQWTGISWEFRPPENYSDLYIRSFADGLDVPGLVNNMEWFGAIIAQLLIAQKAFIETLQAQLLKITGVIYGGERFDKDGNVIDENKTGWWLGANGILKAFKGIFNNIELTADSFEITANNKGYLPVGFIYFQLRGQPSPRDIFSGTWEDISSQYAGLFFRVEGGNAAPFGGANQNMDIQSHNHRYSRSYASGSTRAGEGFGNAVSSLFNENLNTDNNGGTETRPVNTTIRVWIRRT
jgi:hypothetical protein